ncbi:MAG: hypothetical protein HC913_15190 [Microscillaceae bacterium]|nr:hypothetical protein [Microscillaceae bacterium]
MSARNRILRKIFQARQSRTQVVLAAIGLWLGFTLLLFSLQLYLQINRLLNPEQAPPEYLILSKKVSLGNTLFLSRADFGEAELEELKAQPFVKQVGIFTANQFQAYAFLGGRVSLNTELFFEAIPDEFLDIDPPGWDWQEGDKIIPIVLSQDMLNLYNFGFALGKGLPQISPSTVSYVTVSLRLTGLKGRQLFNAKIVGFSERVSSILVPKAFMDWANQTIGEGKVEPPSRVIVQVRNPSDPRLAAFLEAKNYQINQDRLNASRAAALVQVVMSVIGFVGLLFMGLALAVFVMNFRVVIAEAKAEIQLLLQLGYTAAMISVFLLRGFLFWLGGIALLATAGVAIANYYLLAFLSAQGIALPAGPETFVIITGLALLGLMFLLNLITLSQLLRRYE